MPWNTQRCSRIACIIRRLPTNCTWTSVGCACQCCTQCKLLECWIASLQCMKPGRYMWRSRVAARIESAVTYYAEGRQSVRLHGATLTARYILDLVSHIFWVCVLTSLLPTLPVHDSRRPFITYSSSRRFYLSF
jgi:hypothetical protein